MHGCNVAFHLQTDSQNPVSAPAGYRNFSEVQQREATEAVKASVCWSSAFFFLSKYHRD